MWVKTIGRYVILIHYTYELGSVNYSLALLHAGGYKEDMKEMRAGQKEFQRERFVKRFSSKSTKRVSCMRIGCIVI